MQYKWHSLTWLQPVQHRTLLHNNPYSQITRCILMHYVKCKPASVPFCCVIGNPATHQQVTTTEFMTVSWLQSRCAGVGGVLGGCAVQVAPFHQAVCVLGCSHWQSCCRQVGDWVAQVLVGYLGDMQWKWLPFNSLLPFQKNRQEKVAEAEGLIAAKRLTKPILFNKALSVSPACHPVVTQQ